jgi:glutamine---fructose-6-phosphate transaminase (isomerizing)
MCGIMGYVGHRRAEPLIVEGLRRLEYRGYDSAGIATLGDEQLYLRRAAGRLGDLIRKLSHSPAPGCQGIGHTRWATHGPATESNAHPHVSSDGMVAVVHNGVIENHSQLRRQLESEGVVFRSQTDTEVIAQLIAHHLNGDLTAAVRKVLPMLQGTYALAVCSPRFPGRLIAARLGSPLVVGIGQEENFLASDAGALADMTGAVVYLEDRQLAVLEANALQIIDQFRADVPVRARSIPVAGKMAERGAYQHYMLKEIHEQPRVLQNAMQDRLNCDDAPGLLDDAGVASLRLNQINRLILTGCGTSYHAAQVGEYLIEGLAGVSVDVEYASEFRYRRRPYEPNSLVVAISQSGETADTLAAVRECREQGYRTLSLTNAPGSSIARETDAHIDLRAGPEIGVASTKAFTAQVMVLTLLALHLGRHRRLSAEHGANMAQAIRSLPEHVDRVLGCAPLVHQIAQQYHHNNNFLYLGRQYLYPVALEGALKLKEISYIHAEGYPAAEMKHGPIALVDAHTPSVFLSPRSAVFDKVMSNMEEIKARGGPVIAVACEGDREVAERADAMIPMPAVADCLQPIVAVVPLQMLAYQMAVLRDCDVDKPRNLAKSVTVE